MQILRSLAGLLLMDILVMLIAVLMAWFSNILVRMEERRRARRHRRRGDTGDPSGDPDCAQTMRPQGDGRQGGDIPCRKRGQNTSE